METHQENMSEKQVYHLQPRFYIAKLGYARVYLYFLIFPKHRLWVFVRTASAKIKKKQSAEVFNF